MINSPKNPFINREVSWLGFNERVLQEAADERNPLIERLRFLGIFSNNRDEFFRVRVASVKRRAQLALKEHDPTEGDPIKLLKIIQDITVKQIKEFYKIFDAIIAELKNENVFLINEMELNEEQEAFVKNYFNDQVYPALVPIMLSNSRKFPSLRDKSIYFAMRMKRVESDKDKYALIELPNSLPRFVQLPSDEKRRYIIILDDIIRHNLENLFNMYGFNQVEAYTIKLTRDAELDLDSDVSKSFLETMQEGVMGRKKGQPVRFVYDENICEPLFTYLKKKLRLSHSDSLISGRRYHNFKDFIAFPNIGAKNLEFKKQPPVRHHELKPYKSVLKVIEKKDILLHYPYQTYNHLIDLLRESAIDPKVRIIKITLYRVARNSKVINALVNAARNGKDVTVLVELQARFDEENNIEWANHLSDEGIKVIFGYAGLKVHSKICYIVKKEGSKIIEFAHIGTGNFHEKTALIYTDLSLLTSNPEITGEIRRVFELLGGNFTPFYYKNLLVSPLNMRTRMVRMINQEIRNAKNGKPAYIHIKLNSLIDPDLMNKLYNASKAGVEIKLIVRGICGIKAGIRKMSENIEVISILGKYLEHARIFIFGNNEDPKFYIGSADWMERNLDRRIEITCPIFDKNIQEQIRFMFDLQWADNVKSRVMDPLIKNEYRTTKSKRKVHSRNELYNYYLEKSRKL
ncbi:MAG: polyphosphate kinase 1 [Flavobacteriales bacterium]|nr:polyphosphate kinase 1 [Flavobacteriales bacterium]